MTVKKSVCSIAALALTLAAGLPAHADGGSQSSNCDPTPKKPAIVTPVVPEASDFALLSVGALVLLTTGLRAGKRPFKAE